MWAGDNSIIKPEKSAGTDDMSLGNNGNNNNSSVGGGNSNAPALVSVIVSKAAGRYRVQSDSLPALNIIVAELERRIKDYIQEQAKSSPSPSTSESKDNGESSSVVSCSDDLPLTDYFNIISTHFSLRQQFLEEYSLLNDRAQQFRMIQKRLLVRYKDRNPTPLAALDVLMTETYKELMKRSDKIEDIQGKRQRVRNDLDCTSNLIITLLNMKNPLPQIDLDALRAYLCPQFPETDEQGWEEIVDTSVTFLLKTSLSKTAKDSAAIPTNQLEAPLDLDSFKKHLTMVFDRVGKGVKIYASPNSTNTDKDKNKDNHK